MWNTSPFQILSRREMMSLLNKAEVKQTQTCVDVLLGEALNGTFDRNRLGSAVPAEQQCAGGRVFGQDVPQLHAV